MVHSPIKVKDYVRPIESTRKELLQEEDAKIKGRRGMILKGFKTEKQRIEEKIRNSEFLFTSNREDKLNTSFGLDKEKESAYVRQPEMRFKPRTDLERVFEEINKNSFGRVSKGVVDKQLRDLDLNVMVKPKDENEDELIDFQTSQSLTKLTYSRYHTNHTDTNKKLVDKKLHRAEIKKQMNHNAKNLMSDLHNKTHFKAAAVIANRLVVNPTLHSNSSHTGNKIDPYSTRRTNYNEGLNKQVLDFRNPHFKTETYGDFSTLKQVQNMAFSSVKLGFTENELKKKGLNETGIRNKTSAEFDDYQKRDDEGVVIDNKSIPRDRVDLIAVSVLNQCNVNHQKNKNNNKSLKNGEGMLSCTNGMSIREFERKYHLV